MKKFFLIPFVVVLVIAMVLTGCAAPKAPLTGPITIGSPLPLTGPYAMWGGWFKDGINFALDEVNWKVAGREIKVIFEDEGGEDISVALQKVKKLVESDKVDVTLGPFYGSARVATEPYTSSIPILNMSLANTSIRESQNKYVIWTTQSYVDTQSPLGNYAYDKLGLKTMVVMGSDYECPKEFAQGVTDAFQRKGGKLLQEQWAPLTETDYNPYLVSMKKADSLVSTCLGPPPMMTLYNQLAALGLNTKYQIFQAEDGAIPQFVMDEIGEKMLGTLQCLSYHYSVDNPANRKYVAAFQAKFNRMPEAMDAYVYVAMQALLAGLEATGGDTDPATLYNAIIKLKLNTIEGSLSFVPEGQPISNHYIVQVQKVGGKFTQVVIDTIKEVKPVIYRGTNYTKFEAK